MSIVRKGTLAVLLCLLASIVSAGDQGKASDKQLLFVQQPRTLAPRYGARPQRD